jgi:tetratricopeptide (TPR) repeat protein
MKARRKSPEELLRSGLALHQQGKITAAAKCYEDILRIDRNSFPANYFLGLTCCQRKQYRKADELLGRAIAINPEMPEAHYNRGAALLELERIEEAEVCFATAVGLKPGYAQAWFNHGTALTGLKRYEEALASYDMAIALAPDLAEAHNDRGATLEALKRFDEALVSYDQAIALDPGHVEAWGSRGVALDALGRFEEALTSYDKAISLDPTDARSYTNRGNALLALARFDEALASYDKSVELVDDFAEALNNRSFARLLVGDFAGGLEDMEWRKHIARPLGNRRVDKTLWLGAQDLAGKTILVHDEQGHGDTIQFSRYIELLNERDARVLFACKAKLAGLLRSLRGEFELVDEDDHQSLAFDFHCPLMSLPLAFRTELATIPARIPYLRAEPDRIERWAGRIGRGEKLTIGICWQGSTERADRGRSFRLTEFAPISKLPGVHLISLHKGLGEGQLATMPEGMVVETLGRDFDAGPDAFLDTAAVMECCDLIITSDTAIAHLAGALARPVWLALRHVPDWRWQLDRSDTPWYPTMRLFRQSEPVNWRSVFGPIENALQELLDATGS